MSPYQVRGVESLADVQRLVRLYARVWPGSFGIVDLLGSGADCLLLAGAHGTIAGYCFLESDPRRGFTELQDIGIEPEQRGRGLGGTLLGAVQQRHDAVKLIADATKPELIRFYERAGFAVEHVIENYYAIGRDGARMWWRRDGSRAVVSGRGAGRFSVTSGAGERARDPRATVSDPPEP